MTFSIAKLIALNLYGGKSYSGFCTLYGWVSLGVVEDPNWGSIYPIHAAATLQGKTGGKRHLETT